jgi:hypothetical protein
MLARRTLDRLAKELLGHAELAATGWTVDDQSGHRKPGSLKGSLKNGFENPLAACGLAEKIAKPQAAKTFSKSFLSG